MAHESGWDEILPFDTISGRFAPRRRDNLRPAAHGYIGQEISWTVAWRIEEGPYSGQWALMAREALDPPLGWVPQEDVELIMPGEEP